MILDAQNLYSDAQALTATAASTNLIDHGSDRNIGIGEPLVVSLTVDVAADFTSANETYQFDLETDDNAAFSSATVVVSRIITAAVLTLGSKHAIPVPPDTRMERFSRINYTLGGTTPTVTVTAALLPQSFLQNEFAYPDGFTIS